MTRRWTSLWFITIFVIVNSCTKPESSPLEGTWEMETGTYTNLKENQKIETDKTRRYCVKIMSASHFAVVEMYNDNPDSLFFAAVGTYQLTPDKYVETYEASNIGYQVGISQEFHYSLEGNRWTISRSTDDMELNELWVKHID